MIWLLVASARAACPLPPDRIPELDRKGREFLFAEDLEGYSALWDTIAADLACLEEPIDPQAIASLLQSRALYLYAIGGPTSEEWKEPLASALRAWPEMPRSQGAQALRTYQAPAEPPPGPALPAGAQYWLDGREVSAVPGVVLSGATGFHVVQRRTGSESEGTFQTRVLDQGAPWPVAWTVEGQSTREPKPRPKPAPGGSWGLAAVGGGVGTRTQTLAGGRNPFVADGYAAGPLGALASFGQAAAGPVAVGWSLAGSFQAGGGPAVDAMGLVGVPVGPATLLAGGGLVSAVVIVDDASSVRLLPQPHVAARFGAGPFVGEVGGGATPSATHAGLHAGLTFGRFAGLVGVDWLTSRFDQEGGALTLRHDRLVGMLGIGSSFGR